jgi:hypothetical protein
MRKVLWTVVMLAITATAALAAVPAAAAKDGDLRIAGRCTGATTSKLKLSEEDGRVEVEFEVDQNRNGVRWAVVIRRNGVVIRRVSRVTGGRSGSFEVRTVAGHGRFTATATRRGETCRASGRF